MNRPNCSLTGHLRLHWRPIRFSPVNPCIPPIYARKVLPARLSAAGRLLALGIALGCLPLLILAAGIQPNPSGVGTHRQLGLQPCQFEFQTGVPCPTCGMTTAFAHFVRGNILASAYVQPLGAIAALAVAITFWTALYIAFTARPAHRLLRLIPTRYYLVPLLSLVVLAWMWKIAIHLLGRDGWH